MSNPENIKGNFNTEVKRTAREIKIIERAKSITERAESHYQKNERQWINNEYGRQLKQKSAPSLEPTPFGLKKSPQQKISERSIALVQGRQKARLNLIKEASKRMIEGKGKNLSKGRDKDLER